MKITELRIDGYQQVVEATDATSGLHALIAVHDTTLGSALGGLRMWPYASREDALFDVLRLARGMTYKSAVAHTGLGGGKSVILGDPAKLKSEALYLAMGRFVDSLGGTYVTAEDVNTATADLEILRRATKYVSGLPRELGGSGNPSPYTAYGVFIGIQAALGSKFGSDEVKGRSFAVQGVGAVGSALVRRLVKAGGKVMITDRVADRVQALVKELGVKAGTEQEILGAEVDVLAPCALGAVLNDQTIPKLRCQIVAGAANNLLLDPRHGEALRARRILYAPDYVINAGGIINVSVEFAAGGYDEEAALGRIERIPQALREVWEIADQQGIAASAAADRLAEGILAKGRVKGRSMLHAGEREA